MCMAWKEELVLFFNNSSNLLSSIFPDDFAEYLNMYISIFDMAVIIVTSELPRAVTVMNGHVLFRFPLEPDLGIYSTSYKVLSTFLPFSYI